MAAISTNGIIERKRKVRPMLEWTTEDGRHWMMMGNDIAVLVNHPYHDDDVARFARITAGTYDEGATETTVVSPNYRKSQS